MRRVLVILVLVVVGCFAWLRVRDPETRPLDDAARTGVAGQFVRLADGVTHYEVGGPTDGPRVMLVHGFSVPSYIWDSTFVALTGAGFRVARYDVFGRGWSDRPDASYSLDMFDRQLRALLDSLAWREPVHLVGLSFGGAITATFAGAHPERVRSWILIDPVAGGRMTTPAVFALPALGPTLWQGVAMPTMAEGQLTDFVQPARWPDWADRYRVQMQFRGFGRALLRSRLSNADVSLQQMYEHAGASHVPTMLLWGKEDTTVPIAAADSVRTAMRQVEYHVIEGAAHLPHMERTDVVNPLLIEFLRRNAGSVAPATAAPGPGSRSGAR